MFDEEKISVYLSKFKHKNKPTIQKVGSIQNNILNDKVHMPYKEFAEELTVNGRATMLCQFNDDKSKHSRLDEIDFQEIVMLDFDNKDSDLLFTVKDLENDSFIQNNASFWYETFNSEDKSRFRVVFLLDTPAKNTYTVEQIYIHLLDKYPQADKSCDYTTRLFYGGHSGYQVISWANTLKVKKLLSEPVKEKKDIKKNLPRQKKDSNNSYNNYSPIIQQEDLVWQCIKQGNYTKVKELIAIKIANNDITLHDVLFPSKPALLEQVKKSVDIGILLDLPSENNPKLKGKMFKDIFHEDKTPSANIFKSLKDDVFLYKCFSDTNDFTADLFGVVRRLMYSGAGYLDAVDFISKCLNLTVDPSSKVAKIKENVEIFSYMLMDANLKETNPEVHKIFKNKEYLIKSILDILVLHLHEDVFKKDVRIVSYLSVEVMTNKVNAMLGARNSDGWIKPTVSESTISRLINLMTLTGVTSKLTDETAPPWLVQRLNKNKRDKHYKYRNDIYEVNGIDFDTFADITKDFYSKGLKPSKLDRDYALRVLGESASNKVFVQDKNKKTDLSKGGDDLENLVVSIMFEYLYTDGYILEDTLLFKLSKKTKKTKKYVKNEFEPIIVAVCDKYAIKDARFNKQYRDKFKPKNVTKAVKFYLLETATLN